MKRTASLLVLSLFISLCCCKQKTKSDHINLLNTTEQKDSITSMNSPLDLRDEEHAEERRAQRLFEWNDSLLHSITLKQAVAIAKANIHQSGFSYNFLTPPDTVACAKTSVRIGNFFSKKRRHIIVRSEGDFIHINIFLINGDSLQPVLHHPEWSMSHQSDTVRDINGDGYQDLVINGYYVNGCCLRNFSEVYLFQTGTDAFTRNYNFINPTFSPAEHVIRGVEYGHRGQTGLYKYKWNGLKTDTIEQIWYDEENPDYLKHWNKYASDSSSIELKDVPKEYHDIYGYDWFVGE